LTSGELDPALADHGVEGIGERERFLVDLGFLGRGSDGRARRAIVGIFEGEADVARDGGREQEGVLLGVTDHAAERREREIAHVDPVEEDRAARRGEEARQEAASVDLPAPVRPTRASDVLAGMANERRKEWGAPLRERERKAPHLERTEHASGAGSGPPTTSGLAS